ncbi:MAG: hypothetical protein KDD02_07790 [Phaeodactylibacter sp.]|nr:hypothetical protein [Phaeodactylibacter sp.]MCB9302651.1 hypothetical protein [Lewinellaceae bacterium]
MSIEDYCSHIGDLIGRDELKMAIQELHQLLKGTPRLDEAIVQSARYNDIMKQIRLGAVSFDEANLTKNQIRMGILNLLAEIEEQAEGNKALSAEIEKSLSSEGRNIIQNSTNVVVDSKVDTGGGDFIVGGSKNTDK